MKRVRLILSVILAVNYSASFAAQKVSNDSAEIVVSDIGTRIIELIKERSMTQDQKEVQFRKIVTENFSVRNIAIFVLGRYWRIANQEERNKYIKLFEDVVVEYYVAQFGDYKDETFEVVHSRPGVAGGTMVSSIIYRTNADPVKVDWFLRKTESGFKVFDLFVTGISLSITQRSEYAAIIRKHGGRIQGLLNEMERQIAALNTKQDSSLQNKQRTSAAKATL